MTELLSLLQEIVGLLSLGGQDGVQVAIAPVVAAAAISAASSIGNAIFGSVSASKQRREQLKALREERERNRAWYNRRYNEDATQRADAQLMMSRVNAYNKKRSQAAAGRQAVVGGTDATLATSQQANAEAVGNALGDIVVNAESRKDNIESQYRSRDQQLTNEESAVNAQAEASKRAAVAQAATGAINAAGSIIAGESGDSGSETSIDEAQKNAPTEKTRATETKATDNGVDDIDQWQQRKKDENLYA